MLGSAPARSSEATHGRLLMATARASGVSPAWSFASMATPSSGMHPRSSLRTHQTWEARGYSHDGPIRHGKCGNILMTEQSDAGSAGYILMTEQSDTGSAGIFS
eukprot:1187657-Prorocentrum_minimum.AAC.5